MQRILSFAILAVIISACIVSSQPQFEWVRNYPMRGCASAMDSSGNVYIIGYIGNITKLLKYNSSGNLIWQRFDSLNTDGFGINAVSDKFGNVYFTAEVYRVIPGLGYTWVIATVKYDSSGNRNWIKIYSAGFNSRANAMAVDIAGNIYVVGHGNLTGKFNYLTIKYNPQGDTLWTAVYLSPYTYGGSNATAICTDLQCNVYVTGTSINQTTSGDYITVKYNNNGVQQWVAKYDYNNSADGANGIRVDKFGFCYVTGITYYDSINHFCIATIKYTPSGDSVWTRLFAPSFSNAYEYGINILLDSSLNVYVTGLGSDSLLKTGFRIIKYDKYGNALWISFDTNYVDQAYSSVMDKYGKIYSTGSTSNIIYSNGINSLGVRIWGAHYPQSVLPSEHYSGIKLFIDNYDKLYLFGSSLDSSILIKYGTTTNINNTSGIVSESHRLFQNYPNPFNPSTNIRYQISKDKFVSLKVYDVLGREMETLVNEMNKAGAYEVKFNGEYLSTGVYFYSIFIDGMMLETKKMLLIK